MNYSDECMKLWKVFYRLFHGKALRFMVALSPSDRLCSWVKSQAIDRLSKDKAYVLSFDGKKLAPGLNKEG